MDESIKNIIAEIARLQEENEALARSASSDNQVEESTPGKIPWKLNISDEERLAMRARYRPKNRGDLSPEESKVLNLQIKFINLQAENDELRKRKRGRKR